RTFWTRITGFPWPAAIRPPAAISASSPTIRDRSSSAFATISDRAEHQEQGIQNMSVIDLHERIERLEQLAVTTFRERALRDEEEGRFPVENLRDIHELGLLHV